MGSGRSEFRNALQISAARIAALTDVQLLELLTALFVAHAYRCKASVSSVYVNTELRAADDGSDGSTPAPPDPDDWFADVTTCWQFKAGRAGEPANLRGEVTKSAPSKTLREGGRFVVIASGCTSGRPGEEKRIEKLRAEAEAAGLPSEKIDVIGSERLATWCNQHPAVAANWSGSPAGLCTVAQGKRI